MALQSVFKSPLELSPNPMAPRIASWRWPFVKPDFKSKSVAKIDCKNNESQLNTAAQYYTCAALPFFGLQSNHLLIGPIAHCYRVLRFIVGLQDDWCLLSHSRWGLAAFQVLLLFTSSALRLAIPAAILHLIASASLLFYGQRLCLSRRMRVHHLPSRKSVCAKEDRIFRHCNCLLTSPSNPGWCFAWGETDPAPQHSALALLSQGSE